MPHIKKLTIRSPAVSVQLIERRISLIRGQKVMIDEDLAELDGVQRKLSTHDKYFKVVFDEFKKLTHQPTPARKQLDSKKATSHDRSDLSWKA